MVCLSLTPGASPRRVSAVVRRACERQRALAAGWAAQARFGALTRAIPSPVARLILNLVSRRYALSYAEIDAPPHTPPRQTLWGQEVDAVIYWRPPQANISKFISTCQMLRQEMFNVFQNIHRGNNTFYGFQSNHKVQAGTSYY